MTRVRVHFHLTRRTFVVSEKTATGWKVRDYTDAVCLSDVRFVCSAKGRDYCRTKRMRWVHAWAEGTRAPLCAVPEDGTDIVYNPFRDDGFTDGRRLITRADHTSFTTSRGGDRKSRVAVTRAQGAA